MEQFEIKYQEYAHLAQIHDAYWLHKSQQEFPPEVDVKQLEAALKCAVDRCISSFAHDDAGFTEFVDRRLHDAVVSMDFVLQRFLGYLIFTKEPPNIHEGLAFVLENWVRQLQVPNNRGKLNPYLFILEQFIELVPDDNASEFEDILIELLRLDSEDSATNNMFATLRNSVSLLGFIRTEKGYHTLQSLLNHPDESIREDAQMWIETYFEEGLISEEGNWQRPN